MGRPHGRVAESGAVQDPEGTFGRVLNRVLEAILSVLSNGGSGRSGRTFRAVRTSHAIRIDSERLLLALFLLLFAAGVTVAAVQAARLGLPIAFGR
jgi:hypothetical protein